jgi:hypothetical protein
MSKPVIKSLALLVLAMVAYYWKILLTGQFSMLTDYETVSQAYSWFHFWGQSVRAGDLPLWDPFMFGGRSYAGEMQTAGFYPLHLIFALFPNNRFGLLAPQLYHVYFVFAHVLAAWFLFALIRELGLSRFSALVAGLCFSIGGIVGRVPWPHLLESSIWLPLLLLFLIRSLRAASWSRAVLYAALTGLALGMSILAGGLHFVMMQAIVLVTAGVYQAIHAGSGARLRPVALIAVALCVGLWAGAVQLLPSMEYSAHAVRFLSGTALPATQKIPFAYLRDYASAQSLASYLLFPAFLEKIGPIGAGSGEIFNPYLGVFPFLLAVIGLWKGRENPWVRYAAGLAILAFLFSLGQASLLYGLAYATVPLLWMAREAGRFLYLTHFGLVILAAFGAEALFAKAPAPEYWTGLKKVGQWILVVVLLALAGSAIFRSAEMRRMMAFSFLMVILSYILFRVIAAGVNGNVVRFLVVALILFDLSAFDRIAYNKIEVAQTGTDQLERLLSMRGAAAFLKSQPGLFRTQVVADPALNIGDAYGIQTLNGGAVTMATNYYGLMNHAQQAVNLLNVRYFLKPASATDPSPVYADANWKVYPNAAALPRVWVVHQTAVEPVRQRLLDRLGTAGAEPDRVALLHAPLPLPLETPANAAADQAFVKNYAADELTLQVHAGGTGLVVLSEMYDPGWTARVNGAPQPIYEVDGGLRGVVVPSGDNQVVFEYAPRSVRWGGILSAAAFLGTLLAWILWRNVAN